MLIFMTLLNDLRNIDMNFEIEIVIQSQLPGRLFSPSDIRENLSHHFLLHFSIDMGPYDHHAKYQGGFP